MLTIRLELKNRWGEDIEGRSSTNEDTEERASPNVDVLLMMRGWRQSVCGVEIFALRFALP